ncbi:MAG: SDR family oxidoreductase [Terriglobales bacterium]
MKHEAGRVVVITGASSGIGKATALRFARHGDKLVVSARRKNLLNDLVEEIEAMGTEALAVQADVSDNKDVEKLAAAAVKKFGRIDAWVNDAGVGVVGKFHEVPVEDHRRVIETNLIGVINGSHAAIRRFREQGDGVLINISSVAGKVTQPYMSSYSASKHGVRALSASIRQELWLDDAEDIHVCTVFPQSVDTPFFDNEANRSGYKVKPSAPIETPENCAEVIFELAANPRDEAHVGKAGQFMAAQQKISRKATEKQMAWMADRGHLDRSKHERSKSGNLYEPGSDEGAIRAGWTNGSRSGGALKTIGMIAPAALGIYLLVKGRGSSEYKETA